MQLPRAPALFTPEIRRRLQESDRKWRTKAILRIVAAVFCLIGFSLFAAAIPTWDQNFFHAEGPSHGDWQDGMPIGALLFAFLADLAITVYTVRSTKSLHPLINMVVDFLVWGLLIPAVTFAIWGGLFRVWQPAIPDEDGEIVCGIWNVFARECSPVLYTVGGLELGGVVFASFVWALHFTLFVLACIDFRNRRRVHRNGGRDFIELNDNNNYHGPPQYQERPAPKYENGVAERAPQITGWGGDEEELKQPSRVATGSLGKF